MEKWVDEVVKEMDEQSKLTYRSFKKDILEKITKRGESLPDFIIDPVIDQVSTLLDELEDALSGRIV